MMNYKRNEMAIRDGSLLADVNRGQDDMLNFSSNVSNRAGRGYISQNADLKSQTGSAGYEGPSYSVKYLGIVDGSMGVLSRKMALMQYN